MRLASSLMCALAFLPACAAVPSTARTEAPVTGDNVTLLLGQRYMRDDDFEPLDEQSSIGLEYDSWSRYAPVGFELGIAYAEDSRTRSGVDLESDVYEAYAGVRKTFAWANGRLHPYLATGVSFSWAELDADDGSGAVSVDDESFGLYLRGGIYYAFACGFNLGLDYRHLLVTEYKDEGVRADGDFGQVSVGIGYSF